MHVHGRRDDAHGGNRRSYAASGDSEQQAQSDATSSDAGKAEDGTNTSTTADTVEDSTATSTGTSAANTESAYATNTGTTAATGTPAPSLSTQTNPTPAAISTTSQTGYAHSATASQNGVTFTVSWNDAPAGTATTFHITQTNGSSQAKARMDVSTYGTAAAGKRLRSVAPGMGQLLQPSGPRSRSGPKNPRGTTIHLHGASEGAIQIRNGKTSSSAMQRARPAE